jgi:hypothetical protein
MAVVQEPKQKVQTRQAVKHTASESWIRSVESRLYMLDESGIPGSNIRDSADEPPALILMF